MRYFLLNFLFLAITIQVDAQEKIKNLPAKKTAQAPKIDGIIDDAVWKNAPLATDFIAFQPEPGVKEDKAHQTQVYVLYDDQAIYFAARMKESKPEDISYELVDRDNVGNADFFDVVIDTYNDKINASEFIVTSAGIQLDAKFSAQGEDGNWNAVWESAVHINGNEWTAEMRIPYSALRFANKDIQNWGLNFVRNRQKFQQKLTWNELDPKRNGFINQEGELVGIEKIKAPLRLSFSPYLSTYINHYPYNQNGIKNTTNSINGGMDVKYGINESFTLDMTLIPDFGQVQSDNQVLNLTPFEIRYSENRPFFTEGTELFSKGDLFYSRRVGSTPVNQYKVNNELIDGDKIINNPSQTKLLNATKLSGRTSKGLGIGVFNAITEKTTAIIEHTDGTKQAIETAPLTNYNIIVLDQNLKNNSSVSLINSNVTRGGSTYDANVTAAVFDLNTKENKYNLNGAVKMSQLYGGSFIRPSVGYSYQINPGKRSGNFNYNYALTVVDDQFNPNDLGILFNNNYINHSLYLGYNWYKASKWYSQLQVWGGAEYVSRFHPNTYQSEGAYIGGWARFKNLWTANFNIQANAEGNDFYEPRTEGRFFKKSATQSYSLSFNSNQSKKISFGAFFSTRYNQLFKGKGLAYGTYQNFRLSNKLSIGTDMSINPQQNYAGYISTDTLGNIIFSKRDVRTVENSLSMKYTISNKMGFNLRVRHYWSKLINKAFYTLQQDGNLMPNAEFSKNLDQNFNAFNVDMIYIWRFAPGSELSFAWKNAALTFDNHSQNQYFKNLDYTLNAPQNNNFSIKILYYLDYLQLRKKVS